MENKWLYRPLVLGVLLAGLGTPNTVRSMEGELPEAVEATIPPAFGAALEMGHWDILEKMINQITDPSDKVGTIIALLSDKRVRGGTVETALEGALIGAWAQLSDAEKMRMADLILADPFGSKNPWLLGYALAGELSREGAEVLDTVKRFLAKGAFPSVRTSFESTLALDLVRNGQFEAAAALLEAGATWDGITEEVVTTAAGDPETNTLAVAKLILLAKLDPNEVKVRGVSPLITAAVDGDVESVRTLIEAGVDVKFKDEYDQTALRAAATYNRPEVVLLLVEAGAPVDQVSGGQTPLLAAIQNSHLDTAVALIASGADVNFETDEQESSLHFTRDGFIKAVHELIRRGAKLDKLDDKLHTPLMHAAMGGDVQVMKALLHAGANADLKDRRGNNALHHAVSNGQTEAVKLLLEETKLDVNSKNSNQNTPLMMAASTGDAAMIQLLLNAGADTSLKNKNGKTALDLAQALGRKEIAQLIQNYSKGGSKEEEE